MRYEISINKTRRIKTIIKEDVTYCNTLSDLTSPDVWRLFGKELLNVFDSLLIVDKDNVNVQRLSVDDIKLYTHGVSSGYWLRKWDYNKQKHKELNRFKEIVDKHSASTLKEDVKKLISDKINSLINIQNVPISPFEKLKTEGKNVPISPFEKSQKEDENLSRFHHLRTNQLEDEKDGFCPDFPTWITGEIGTNPTPQNRLCKVTGLSLEIGIKQGEYLSAKGVEFYYYNHPDIYQKKLAIRLSKKWVDSDLKIQFREIAHSIRNEIYNPQNNFNRDIKKRENSGISFLFSLAETIRPDKRKYL